MHTNKNIGLTDKEVLKNREIYGTNEIITTNKNSFWKKSPLDIMYSHSKVGEKA